MNFEEKSDCLYLSIVKSHYSYHVYILQCSDGSYYTGMTNDLERRLEEHHSGFDPGCYTFTRRPLLLKFSEAYQFVDDAILRENQIKGWNRKKKEALIKGDMDSLKLLSKKRADGSSI